MLIIKIYDYALIDVAVIENGVTPRMILPVNSAKVNQALPPHRKGLHLSSHASPNLSKLKTRTVLYLASIAALFSQKSRAGSIS